MKFTLSGRYSEQSLLKGCLKGARDSQKALYDQYSSRMYSICLRYAGTETDAEDLLQEGFLRIFKNIGTFRNEGSFEGWMRRIFVNTAIEKHRKKHHLYPLMDVSDSDTFVMDSGIVNQMAADDIMCLVEQLSPGYRTVFNLSLIHI